VLPPLTARWLSEALPDALPSETAATCNDCAMKAKPGEPLDPSAEYFNEGKCCTYLPHVYNFAAGGVLLDEAPDAARGKAEFDKMIASRAGVTPLGVGGPQSYWLRYGAADGSFGRARSLRCPYYQDDTGNCGVWRHRESTCSTWFCKHDRGAVGEHFWSTLHGVLRAVEEAVARHCALVLDLGEEALALLAPAPGRDGDDLSVEDLDGGAEPKAYRRRWGTWHGRERDYYKACARIAQALTWKDVSALLGVDGRLRVQLLRSARATLKDLVPPLVPLRLGRYELVRVLPEEVRVNTYREYDPVDVPPQLLAALQRFDGRPTAQVLKEIVKQDGLDLSADLLRTLADFELLVPAEEAR